MAGILPIEMDKLEELEKADKQLEMKIETPPPSPLPKSPPPTDVSDDEKEAPDRTDEPMFVKPKPQPTVEISKRTGKPKRKCSEKQLANLKRAQEASRQKRSAVKEARELQKTAKKMEIASRKKATFDKKMEEDAIVEMRRKIYLEESSRAKADATWDEERLTNLMTRTIGNYLDEKKKTKTKAERVHSCAATVSAIFSTSSTKLSPPSTNLLPSPS